MHRQSKWIATVRDDELLSNVAAGALAMRLRVACRYFERAAKRGPGDATGVHQTRVWSRRSLAAFRLFRGTLPRRAARRMRRTLDRIRRAAGEARDLDVLAARIDAWIAAQTGPQGAARKDDRGAGELHATANKLRRRARRPIRKLARRWPRRRLKRAVDKLLKKVRWRGPGPEPTFVSAAHDGLGKLAGEFFDLAAAGSTDVASLHCLRIAGKKLRYGMEAYAAAFDRDFRARLHSEIEELQSRLGEINDYASAAERVAAWPKAKRSGRWRQAQRGFVAHCERELDKAHRAFAAWWTPTRMTELRDEFAKRL